MRLYLIYISTNIPELDAAASSSLSFHYFIDVSKDAHAAVIFSRVKSENGVEVQVMEAKSWVAPREDKTISRLELLAASIGATLMHVFDKVIGYRNVSRDYWTNFFTVLTWIQHEKQ